MCVYHGRSVEVRALENRFFFYRVVPGMELRSIMVDNHFRVFLNLVRKNYTEHIESGLIKETTL